MTRLPCHPYCSERFSGIINIVIILIHIILAPNQHVIFRCTGPVNPYCTYIAAKVQPNPVLGIGIPVNYINIGLV